MAISRKIKFARIVIYVASIALLLLVVFLVGALRALPRMGMSQQQLQAQYWQYQQNMQAYGGYHAPMTPPPPPPSSSPPAPDEKQNPGS